MHAAEPGSNVVFAFWRRQKGSQKATESTMDHACTTGPPGHPTSYLTHACMHDILLRSYTPHVNQHLFRAKYKTTRTHRPLYSSSIRPSQQDFLLYTQFFCTHPSSISSSIHSIHCGTHLSLYLNISMCDLVLKDLLRRI
jgi:hypothetical protein